MLLDAGVHALAKLTSLTSLNLAYCKWISDTGVSEMSTLTALTLLNLQGCSQTAPCLGQGLASLHNMPHLAKLNLGSCRLAPGALMCLASLTQLTDLSMRFCKGTAPADLVALETLCRLKHLDLSGFTACTDSSLNGVSGLKYLQKLHIGFNRHITDAGLAHLTGLSHLAHLSLNGSLVTEAAMESLLATLPSLIKMVTTESHDGEQWSMLHHKRIPVCFANLPLLDIEQGLPIDNQ